MSVTRRAMVGELRDTKQLQKLLKTIIDMFLVSG
jgi:hypothetical protein